MLTKHPGHLAEMVSKAHYWVWQAKDRVRNMDSKAKHPTWQFHAETSTNAKPVTSAQPPKSTTVKWTASEFIEHNKGADWYTMLIIGGVLLAAVIYLLTKDIVSVVMTVIVAIVFGVFAAHKPRVLEYQIDGTGINIGPKSYAYSNFKSFALVSEDTINSIWLMPLKRFMPIITVYFAPEDEKKILEVISNYLPVQNHQPDPIDRLMHKLRF